VNHPLSGVHAAAVTPLKADTSPDLEALPGLLKFLAERGCHGALLLGTTGEGPSFSAQERMDIMRAGMCVREELPKMKLMAGTGTPSLTETISLTHAAFDMGYEAVVVLPPYYYRKATDDGLFQWFSILINAAVPADGTLLGYHFPSTAGIGFSLDLLQRLKDAFPKQFAGIKDSSHEADLARNLGERFGGDLLVLTGTDSYMQLAMENHAAGCITAPANLISPELRALWDRLQKGEPTGNAQERAANIRHALEGYMPFPPLLKALLAKCHGFPRWAVRPPLVEMGVQRVDSALHEYEDWMQGR
jgi:4-hydroxy-tetrahydrodipicolinate synthase